MIRQDPAWAAAKGSQWAAAEGVDSESEIAEVDDVWKSASGVIKHGKTTGKLWETMGNHRLH